MLRVIEEFRKMEIGILGGDVLRFRNGEPQCCFDNFYFDDKGKEIKNWKDYVKLSL